MREQMALKNIEPSIWEQIGNLITSIPTPWLITIITCLIIGFITMGVLVIKYTPLKDKVLYLLDLWEDLLKGSNKKNNQEQNEEA